MNVVFSPEDLAILFTRYQRPMPPVIEGVLRHEPEHKVRKRVEKFNSDMVARGLLVEVAADQYAPSEEFGAVLTLCLNPEVFIAVEGDDGFLSAFYGFGDSYTRLAPMESDFELSRVDGRKASMDEFLSVLGICPSGSEFVPFEIGMKLAEGEPLFKAFKTGDELALRAFCEGHLLEYEPTRRFLTTAYGEAGTDRKLRVTATRHGEAGIASTRIFAADDGVTAMQWLLHSEEDMLTYLARIPAARLFDYVSDFVHRAVRIL